MRRASLRTAAGPAFLFGAAPGHAKVLFTDYANLLSKGPAETWQEDLEEIRKAAERAAALTRQLLAFSRRQAIQPRVLDLNAETLELEKMLRRMLGEDVHWELVLAFATRAKDAPRLLLTDMGLPDINGMELTRRIRTMRPGTRVLLISGYLDRDFGNFVVDPGLPFLQKPFSPTALAALVRNVLDAKS